MQAFAYTDTRDPVRADLGEAHRCTWAHIAAPGSWLTGAERVAVADETRRAHRCALCAERKAALSPFAVEGEHEHGGVLPDTIVDEVHRVTTDAKRLTESWQRGLLEQGLDAERYVEALGVAVLTISIDRFHHALGLLPEPLPEPQPGEPSHERPAGVVEGEAWVPMVDPRKGGPAEREIFPVRKGPAPYVIRALSLVPPEVHAWVDLSSAQYLSPDQMTGFGRVRAIDRAQIELLAGRVSALNECFY